MHTHTIYIYLHNTALNTENKKSKTIQKKKTHLYLRHIKAVS